MSSLGKSQTTKYTVAGREIGFFSVFLDILYVTRHVASENASGGGGGR